MELEFGILRFSILFSVIFVVTGATFTDPLTCSLPILSFFVTPHIHPYLDIGLYRENAIAIESEARYPNGGNVYYVPMQITFHIPEFARKERNLHCDVYSTHALPPFGSLVSFWIERS